MPLPDPKTAYDKLFTDIHCRAFFGRLAQHGLSPANEKQAEELLTLSGKLRVLRQNPQVKLASDPVAQASAALDGYMSRNGLDGGIKSAAAQEASVARRNVAMKLAQDGGIYDSVLSLKSAEAAKLAASLGLATAAA